MQIVQEINWNAQFQFSGGTERGYHRNIWDLSPCPSLAKLFFGKGWKLAAACYLLIFLVIVYFITKEQLFAELLKVSFGLVIGALVGEKAESL